MPHVPKPAPGFLEGVKAKAEGLRKADNPYDLQSPEHDEWEAGRTATPDLDEDADPASNRDQPADNPRGPDDKDPTGA